MLIDARIPVVFGVAPAETDALLDTPAGVPTHSPGCACCIARGPAAAAFDQLFLDRVRGAVPWFTRVVVAQDDAAHQAAIRATVANDPVISTRFRLA